MRTSREPIKLIRALLSLVLGVSIALPFSWSTQVASASTSCSDVDRARGWVARENAKPGDPSWDKPAKAKYSGTVSGWFDKVSVSCGDKVGLHLSGNSRPVDLRIYRMGFYNGSYARLVYSTVIPTVAKASQPVTIKKSNTTYTNWKNSKTIVVDGKFITGIYMARFDDGSRTSFAPLVVKDNQAASPLLLVASTMTWQAYNTYGGWSLYHGPDTSIYDPGRIVSFNRPYDRDGKSNYTVNEAGLVRSAERAGLDIAYTTDNDIDAGLTGAARHTTLIFGGHSEYWTTNMQNMVLASRDFGVNVLFFGGNQAYWRARMENSGRNLAVWKSDPLDPYKNNSSLITNKWGATPNIMNQSTLLGALFAGFGVLSDYRVKDGSSWIFKNTGLNTGDSIVGVVGNEVDTIDKGATPGVQTLLNSNVTIKGINYNVALTYYTTESKSGVIDVSTNGWVCSITKTCSWVKTSDATAKVVNQITQNILVTASKGPLGYQYQETKDVPARTEIAEVCDLACPGEAVDLD